MQQFFCEQPLSVGSIYTFTRAQAHHARDVLKLHHETVRLVSDGQAFYADAYVNGSSFEAKVLEADLMERELPVDVTLAMALIRREKFELVLQKAAELGVNHIIPFESSRCVVHAKKEKTDRWQAILQEASEQCKRNRIPDIAIPVSFSQLDFRAFDCVLIPYEKEAGAGKGILSTVRGRKILIIIGPEGGFSEAEVQQAMDKGAVPISLGPRILRAETAAMFCLSAIGAWSEKE